MPILKNVKTNGTELKHRLKKERELKQLIEKLKKREATGKTISYSKIFLRSKGDL